MTVLRERDRAAAAWLAPPRCTVAHAVRDRVRLRIEAPHEAQAEGVAEALRAHAGVASAHGATTSGAVRLRIDPARTCAAELARAAVAWLERPGRSARAPAAPRRSHPLLNSAVLFAVATGQLGPATSIASVALTALPPLRRVRSPARCARTFQGPPV